MQDVVKLVSAELRGAWRYRWHALGVAWAVCALGWLAVYFTPDKYEASSRFYVDTSSALAPFVRNLSVEMDVDQQVDLVKQLIVGREALLKVARETDLDIEATTPIELDSLLESLRERIMVTGGGPSAYQSTRAGPQLPDQLPGYGPAARGQGRADHARLLHRGHAEEAPLGLPGRSRLPRSSRFEQQEQRLAEAEQKLAEFKRRNIGRLPTEQGSYVDNLQVEMTELQNLRSQESMLLSRRQQLTTQLAAERQYVPSGVRECDAWRDPTREWQRPRFPDPRFRVATRGTPARLHAEAPGGDCAAGVAGAVAREAPRGIDGHGRDGHPGGRQPGGQPGLRADPRAAQPGGRGSGRIARADRRSHDAESREMQTASGDHARGRSRTRPVDARLRRAACTVRRNAAAVRDCEVERCRRPEGRGGVFGARSPRRPWHSRCRRRDCCC